MTFPQVRPPKQQRSRETLERILEATRSRLREVDFSELSLNEIVDVAGVSSSSFYARFPSKDALLHCLHEDYCQQWLTVLDDLASRSFDDWELVEVLRLVLRIYLRQRRENLGVLRAVGQAARRDPHIVRRRRRTETQLHHAVRAFFAARPEFAAHPDPARTADLVIQFASAVIRMAVDHPEQFETGRRFSDEELVAELAAMTAAYLER